MIHVNFKKLNESAQTPKRGSMGAAGYDLYAVLDEEQMDFDLSDYFVLAPGAKHKFRTGIAIELPPGYYAQVTSRSGTSWGQDLEIVGNCGTIDDDYRGEIIVPLRNVGTYYQKVYNGQRIAQMIVQKYETVDFEEKEKLNETERSENGFGSTGKY